MPRSYSSDSDEYVFLPVRRAANEQDRGRRGGRRSPETVVNNTFLGVPGQGRPRATSAGHAPQPNINIVVPEASRSRSRTRHRHHRSRSSSSSSSSRSRSRHARRPSATRSVREDDLPYELRRELDYARLSRREAEERELQEKVKKMRVEETNKIKQEMEEEKRRKKEERERILREARAEEERNKAEELALKKRILREEQERIAREKEKKKLEEEEFEEKFKKKFREAGYSEEYIESVLHKKRAEQQHSQPLAIDLKRPTFIKVHRKYLHPDTLDAFHLPWEWDSRDDEYIIIKQYISQDLQEELFEHTKMLQQRKLITGPYTKETTVKLTPNVYKDKDKMYLVREKSKSPSRSRRGSWMFT